jgi:hypothetical protein
MVPEHASRTVLLGHTDLLYNELVLGFNCITQVKAFNINQYFFLVPGCKAKWTTFRNFYAKTLREKKNIPPGSTAKKRGRGGKGQRKPYFADSMFVETDFMGRHKRVGSNLDATLKEDAEDTASENEGANSLLQTETLINIEKRQSITTVPKAENSFVYKVA